MDHNKPSFITAVVIKKESQNHRYLLIRRCGNHLYHHWQFITGGIEIGETSIEATLREIQEETGLQPDQFYLGDHIYRFYDHNQDRIQSCPVFVAFIHEDRPVALASKEHDQYEWLSFEDAYQRLEFYNQKETLEVIDRCFVKKIPNPRLLLSLRMFRKPFLQTERLKIYPFQEDDLLELFQIFSDKEVMEFSLSGQLNIEQTQKALSDMIKQHQENQIGPMAVVLKETNVLIGLCGLFWHEIEGKVLPELGFRFAKKYWGKGFAFEAASLIKAHAREKLKIVNIYSIIESKNNRSINLSKKLGGCFEKTSYFKSIPVEIYKY